MKKPEYLYQILRNKAIAPRYVFEPLGYLGLTNYGIVMSNFVITGIDWEDEGKQSGRSA